MDDHQPGRLPVGQGFEHGLIDGPSTTRPTKGEYDLAALVNAQFFPRGRSIEVQKRAAHRIADHGHFLRVKPATRLLKRHPDSLR